MENKKYIPALGYDFLSKYYDLTIKLTMPENTFRAKLIDWLNPLSDENILEFGFGTAQNLILLKVRKPEAIVQGVDIDPKIKSIAEHKLKQHNLSIPLHLYDGEVLPFADKSFDKVFSSLVFHQLEAKTKLICLKELHRVLKPNGKLIIGDWGKAKSKWMRFSFYAVQFLDGFKTTNDNVNGLLPQFISNAGFKQVSEVDFINTKIGTYSYYQASKHEQ
ncbi:MAG: class I SAM-dependent methyltransferase [Bacteroidetes bacterium]|jgi:ubiquinone/menaquinone biosynthesis C-methylase UbiE|nr:MAG: class I SAM-dependent methyltransferase [Bacteroidota bacterium]REK36116.1 MAG: class I SAM-dependent methyltransferase [Bacteroidota bacterium]REK51513.1 MAG: class I SAM-dependent methyltransferase [Bacteroidota bacterium]